MRLKPLLLEEMKNITFTCGLMLTGGWGIIRIEPFSYSSPSLISRFGWFWKVFELHSRLVTLTDQVSEDDTRGKDDDRGTFPIGPSPWL